MHVNIFICMQYIGAIFDVAPNTSSAAFRFAVDYVNSKGIAGVGVKLAYVINAQSGMTAFQSIQFGV